MRLLTLVTALLAVSLAAFAQSDRGTITGTVSDPASAIIPGAKISAKNVETGANLFNRTEMGNPSSGNALQTPVFNAQGVPTAGFGFINASSLASGPRQGQLLARFRF